MCAAAEVGTTCFEHAGDDQWVEDTLDNGLWNTRVQIQTDYGKVRWCANQHGVNTWHECDFDHVEDSCVRFQLFEQNGNDNTQTRRWSGWSAKVRVDTGGACEAG